jgi:hypothetical protein
MSKKKKKSGASAGGMKGRISRLRAADPDYPPREHPLPPVVPLASLPHLVLENPS